MPDKNEGYPLSFRLKGDLGPRFEKALKLFKGEIRDSNFARMAIWAAVEALERQGQIPMPMKFVAVQSSEAEQNLSSTLRSRPTHWL